MKEIAIKENHLYRKTFQRGKRWSGRYVTVSVLKDLAAKKLMRANPQKKYVNRIGLSVPKKEDGAIGRNRTKRIIREALRHIVKEGRLKTGWLIVISSRPTASGAKSTDIENDLRYIFKKLDMLQDREEQGK